MPTGYSAETVGVLDSTLTVPAKSDGRVVNAKQRVFQATLDLAAATVAKASGDNNVLFRIPAGYKPLYGVLIASATMGAVATIAIGKAGATGKYRTAAIFTAVDTPTLFMNAAAADDSPLDADEDVILTIAAAALPGAGTLQVLMVCAGR
jgi:hypothetical protein